MARNARIPRTPLTGIYGGLLKFMMRRTFGRVPEAVEVAWHNTAVFKDMMQFGQKTEKWKELDANLATYAHMATAALVGCSFCLDFNYYMAHNKGLDAAKAREVPRWRVSSLFTPLERRVLEYAEAMSQTPPSVTDELSALLLEELGAPALLELTARIGFANLSARNNVALGIHSEGFAASCGLTPLSSSREPVLQT